MKRPLIQTRPAVPADSDVISRLYRDVYATGEAAEENRYPFPQFFDPAWVAHAVSHETICWVVAESQKKVIATAGAVRNIGSPEDRIAEGFGLVVDSAHQGRGIAQTLYRFLTERLAQESCFIISETRTAHPGGWRVVRACGYVPIGFVPFAHLTPAGVESMLLTAFVPEHAARQRVPAALGAPSVSRLASTVLSFLHLPANKPGDAAAADGIAHSSRNESLRVLRDDAAGERLLAASANEARHASGVLGLSRLEGWDPKGKRFERQYYVGHVNAALAGCVRIAWDGLDRRARILELRTFIPGVESQLLHGTFRLIRDGSKEGRLSLTMDVRCDAIELQDMLQAEGFHATAFYPGFIARGNDRIDAVQYTNCVGSNLAESWQNVQLSGWPLAMDVATLVAGAPP